MVKRPPNLESQFRKGIVSTTQDRFNNLVQHDRPKLTVEVAMQQIMDGTVPARELPDMSRQSMGGVNGTFGVAAPDSAASVLVEGGRTSGMTARDDFFSQAVAQASADS